MNRILPALLVLVATFGIVHGDLLRPCQCGPDNPYSCGFCPSGTVQDGPSEAPC